MKTVAEASSDAESVELLSFGNDLAEKTSSNQEEPGDPSIREEGDRNVSLGAHEVDEKGIVRKVRWKILPLLWTNALVCYIDRSNSAFAALEMRREIGLSDASYGLGSSVFFIGYMLFEVPSNYMLVKYGAPRWLFRIALSWGLVATFTAFVSGTWSFVFFRLLLGIAEAGAFPGMWYYMSLWFSENEFGESYAILSSASAVAGIVGGLLAAMIFQMDGVLGISGWRWLFLLEGMFAVAFAFVLWQYLPEGPEAASWLSSSESLWLGERQDRERRAKHDDESFTAGPRETLADIRVWWVGAAWALAMCGYYGILFWIPIIIQSMIGTDRSATLASIVSVIPYGFAAIFMLLNATHSRITNERRFHIFVPIMLGSLCLAIAPHITGLALPLMVISIATAGVWGLYGPLYSLPNTFLVGKGAAIGVAAINSCGSIGGFAGPLLIGVLGNEETGNARPFTLLAILLGFGGMLMLIFPFHEDRAKENAQFTGSTHPVLEGIAS